MCFEKVNILKIKLVSDLASFRSWTGLMLLTEPDRGNGVSHLQTLIDILYLDNHKVRKRLIYLLYEMVNIAAPSKKAKTFNEALKVSDPSHFRESWKLAEDFVAKEGNDILPRLAKSRCNLLESHTGLVLAALLKTELPDALVEVIVTSSAELSIVATVLLGEILHLVHLLLPRELNATSHCLPALLAHVSSSDPIQANRASEAVDALQKLHDLKKNGPKASSLFLDQIMKSGSDNFNFGGEGYALEGVGGLGGGGGHLHSACNPNWNEVLKAKVAAGVSGSKSDDERVLDNVRHSGVNNTSYSWSEWKWDLITASVKMPSNAFKQLDNSDYRTFIHRVVYFFKPSGGQFCKIELSSSRARYLAKTGCYILDFLLKEPSAEATKLLDEFLSDVYDHFRALASSPSAHDCLMSPTRIATTACQYYFLFMGRLSRSDKGRQALDRHNILPSFLDLLTMRDDKYLKLVISSLDYTCEDWLSRTLLSKALSEGTEACRLYATRFLGVLVRSRTANVSHWGIQLLVSKLFDESEMIASAAVDILDDACDDKMNLEAVVCEFKTKLPAHHLDAHIGLKFTLFYTRFLTSPSGFKLLKELNYIELELRKWSSEYNVAYVAYIEELLNDGFSRHQLNHNGQYGRRSFESHSLRDVFVPPHLYGQLSIAKNGLEILERDSGANSVLRYLVDKSHAAQSNALDAVGDQVTAISLPASEWVRAKSCIWAVAHICLSARGATWVDQRGGVIALVDFAERCDVLSLQATAFYALGLVATTWFGSKALATRGWFSIRHERDERWPVLEDWFSPMPHHPHPSFLGGAASAQGERGGDSLLNDDQDSDDVASIATSVADEVKFDPSYIPMAAGSSPVKDILPSTTAHTGTMNSSSRNSTPQRPMESQDHTVPSTSSSGLAIDSIFQSLLFYNQGS